MAEEPQSYDDFGKSLPATPRRATHFTVAPMIYPRAMRRITDLLDALNALEREDSEQEGPYTANGTAASIPIWSVDSANDRDPNNTVIGWCYAADAGCWVFVPFVPQIEYATEREMDALELMRSVELAAASGDADACLRDTVALIDRIRVRNTVDEAKRIEAATGVNPLAVGCAGDD